MDTAVHRGGPRGQPRATCRRPRRRCRRRTDRRSQAVPARAATIDGPPVETHTQFCQPTLSGRTNLTVISTGAQPRVGEDFHLLLTFVGLNRCLAGQSAGINLRLPLGTIPSPTGQSACVTFRSSNPGGTTVTVPCVATDAGGGHLRIDPQGAASWTLVPGVRDSVQVQLAVRPLAAGQRTAFGAVCDSGSSVPCSGSPVANAIPSVTFGIAAAPAQPPPPPPPPPPTTVSPDQLSVAKGLNLCGGGRACPDAITATSIRVRATITGARPAGTWRIQTRPPGAGSFTTIASRSVPAGSALRITSATATDLQPDTVHRFRACFTPLGSAQVCGAEIALRTDDA